NVLRSYELALLGAGMNNVIPCGSGIQAEKIVREQNIELILLDMVMPGISGEELLNKFTEQYPEIPIIMVTCIDSLEEAIKCMQNGAADYMAKPVDIDKLLAKICKHMEINELRRENKRLKNTLLAEDGYKYSKSFAPIISNNKYMYMLFRYCETIAVSKQPVLITGETGVGKELFAKAIHEESKCPGKLVTVNIAGFDDNMISDALFGHTKGAFTGAMDNRSGVVEEAAGGTLFIDEIGDLNIASQIKLLRLLQEREYQPLGSDKVKTSSARVILATHRDLHELQRDEKFRNDLYYRISTHHIEIPPLRDRSDDIILLLNFFISKVAKELGRKEPDYPMELVKMLKSYSFPGNVRELEAMVYDAVVSNRAKELSAKVFSAHIKRNSVSCNIPIAADTDLASYFSRVTSLPGAKELNEVLTHEAMNRAAGNQSIAAEMLGITSQALNARLKKMKAQ
ncbi:MAG: sigma-54 dependent transcriptional regulator, partial [Victivallaceae bacterium]|nr:sigma-54 dependent transcriptional regulator [Victivallaceae bacterium]